MNTRAIVIQHQSGFSIIDALIAFVIVAVGLLAIGSFQVALVSGSAETKTRSEAMQLAQKNLEEFKEYTFYNEITWTSATPSTPFLSPTTETGNNAVFTIAQTATVIDSTLAADGVTVLAVNQVQLEVVVSWKTSEDALGNDITDSVLLNTIVTFTDPRTVGDFAASTSGPLVSAPTGRAYLGEGDIDTDDETEINPGGNKDGNKEYQRGDNRILVNNIDSTSGVGTVVLTLADACVSGTCTEFVKINGRVYIDTASQNQLTFGDVFVKASDAAFCNLWVDNDLDDDGNNYTVSGNPHASPAGDYNYVEYSCYLGGGWHGNIGILIASGIQQNDKVCMGDPVSMNAWEEPEISLRRSYRGMRYNIDNNDDPVRVDVNDASSDIIWYSIGIADGAAFSQHDFVISSMSPSDTTGDKCELNGILVRADSSFERSFTSDSDIAGSLFENNEASFVCLNRDDHGVDINGELDTAILPDGLPDYLDGYSDFVSNGYGAGIYCPYDPTDPPTNRHIISGTIDAAAGDLGNLAMITIKSSDGEGNCSYSIDVFGNGSYSCDVYDWGNGWVGYIQSDSHTDSMVCDPFKQLFSGVSTETTGATINCYSGDVVNISGRIDMQAHTNLVNLDGVALQDSLGNSAGNCTYFEVNGSDIWEYTCQSTVFDSDVDEGWAGTLILTLTQQRYNCPPMVSVEPPESSDGVTVAQTSAGGSSFYIETADRANISLDMLITNNAGQCPSP